MLASRIGEIRVDRQRLLGGGGNSSCGQTFVERNSQPRRFSGRIESRPVDQLDEILLSSGGIIRAEMPPPLENFQKSPTHTWCIGRIGAGFLEKGFRCDRCPRTASTTPSTGRSCS